MNPSESRSITTGQVAELTRGELRGSADRTIYGVQTVEEASETDLTFISSAAFARKWEASRAVAALVSRDVASHLTDSRQRPVVLVPDAENALVAILQHFEPPPSVVPAGVHSTAMVDPTAHLGRDICIGPHVWIDRGCVIGDGSVLHTGVRLYRDVQIGTACVLHANTVVRERCRLGRNVVVHQNASIGADGFGYIPSQSGAGLTKVPHVGDVIIHDHVEIGANTCIDRGKFGSTVIGEGTKVDNLCMIAHNCRIGKWCVLAAQTGLAGSCVVGDGVQLAGQVGVIDHISIGAQARVGARSAVLEDVPAGESWLGYPAGPVHSVLRQWAALRRLPRLIRKSSGLLGRGPEGD